MKGFKREDSYLSLCGLNCKLCSMELGGHCGGCGFGNQSCPIARCSLEHGGVEYCIQCPEYPCERYAGIDTHDCFITSLHRKRDLEKLRQRGSERYAAEQKEKRNILDRLLAGYNDGRKKTLFCLAVNLLELDNLRTILENVDRETAGLTVKEKAAYVVDLLEKCADKSGIALRLRKKPTQCEGKRDDNRRIEG